MLSGEGWESVIRKKTLQKINYIKSKDVLDCTKKLKKGGSIMDINLKLGGIVQEKSQELASRFNVDVSEVFVRLAIRSLAQYQAYIEIYRGDLPEMEMNPFLKEGKDEILISHDDLFEDLKKNYISQMEQERKNALLSDRDHGAILSPEEQHFLDKHRYKI